MNMTFEPKQLYRGGILASVKNTNSFCVALGCSSDFFERAKVLLSSIFITISNIQQMHSKRRSSGRLGFSDPTNVASCS